MSILKDLKLYFVFAKQDIGDRLDAPLAFTLVAIGTLVQITVNIIFFQSIFLRVNSLGGWTLNQMYVLIGTFFLINSLGWVSFIRGFQKTSRIIERGELDIILTKPIKPRLYLASRWNDIIFSTPTILFSLATIIYGAVREPIAPNWGLYIITVICGLIIYLSIISIIQTLNFFWIIHQAGTLESEIYNLARYPIDIYKGFAKIVLSIIIPVATAVTIPARALLGGLSIKELAILFIITIIFFFGSKVFWTFGLKHYQSANG
jgi:ABC-2 type transport system permease protein